MGASHADVFQSPDPAASVAKDQDVDVSGAMLSQPPLLLGVECVGDQHLDPQRTGSWS
jgi:hypothetical protein